MRENKPPDAKLKVWNSMTATCKASVLSVYKRIVILKMSWQTATVLILCKWLNRLVFVPNWPLLDIYALHKVFVVVHFCCWDIQSCLAIYIFFQGLEGWDLRDPKVWQDGLLQLIRHTRYWTNKINILQDYQ